MQYRRFFFRLLAVALVMLWACPAMSTPVVYTDRAAFDAAAGDYTLLTLDAPSHTFEDPSISLHQTTYNDLIVFSFDHQGGVGVLPGEVVMGRTGLHATAEVLQPVTAFGFDVISQDGPNSVAFSMGDAYQLSGTNFLGFVSVTPFTADLAYNNLGTDPMLTNAFVIDNIAIKSVFEPSTALSSGVKSVPEPSTWLLAVGGLTMLALRRAMTKEYKV